MKAGLIAAVAVLVALGVAAPVGSDAQTTLSTPPPMPAEPVFAAPQLDQLLAPIALYPDELLGQILMAATYPLEVVEASRWLQDPTNRSLTGDGLAAALAQQDWDPSVKALVPFPQILQMMNDRLDWMQKLGDAFLGQQAEVMDTVQRLRRQAQAAGTLASTPQQVVTTDGQMIVIEPANPEFIYPPYYDPVVVYGPWPYPDYPPYYFPPPRGYVFGPPLFFGFGFAVLPTFWGWDHMDWGRRGVRIDVDRFNRVNRQANERWQRPPVTQPTWQHDPSHRRGVAYRGPAARAQFAPPVAGSPDARRSYRGFDNTVGATPGRAPPAGADTRRGTSGQPGAAGRGPALVQPPLSQQQQFQRRSPTGMAPPVATPPPATQQQQQFQRRPPTGTPPPATQPQFQRGAPTVRTPPPVAAPPPIQQPAQTRLPTVVRPPPTPPPVSQPPAFQGIGRGQDVRTQSSRGQQSLQAPVPRAAPPVAAPAPHPAPQPAARPSGGGGGGQRDGKRPGDR